MIVNVTKSAMLECPKHLLNSVSEFTGALDAIGPLLGLVPFANIICTLFSLLKG